MRRPLLSPSWPRLVVLAVSLLLLVFPSGLSVSGLVKGPPVAPLVFSYTIKVVYRNLGERVWHMSELDVAVGLFLNTSWQEVKLVWTSRPIEQVIVDEDGNRWAILAVPDLELEPGESLEFSAEYRITAHPRSCPSISIGQSGSLSDIPGWLRDEFTGPTGSWLTEDEELRELALNLSAGRTNVLEIVAAFVSWIHEHVSYKSFEVPLYPNETYRRGLGDCDDQANLLITLCRAIGIPAYLQVGCIYLPSEPLNTGALWDGHVWVSLTHVGWHGWAVVYVPPWGWLPVDLTYAYNLLDVDPLNAVKMAAIWSQNTILAMEVRRSDYVGDTRAMRDFVVENDIYIYQEEVLKCVEKPRLDFTVPYVLLTAVCLVAAAAFIALAYYLTKQQPKPVVQSALNLSYQS